MMNHELYERARALGGDDLSVVWETSDALTVTTGSTFIKVSDRLDLVAEARKTLWVGQYLRAARVCDAGRSGDVSWMVTEKIAETDMSVEDRCRLIGRSLREFHETLPMDCPWRITLAQRQEGKHHGTIEEDLVVTHGDPCVPNMVGGTWIDLGDVAVSDRWWDVSVARMSVDWPINFGPGHGHIVRDAYCTADGFDVLECDEDVFDFYRDLYETVLGFPS